MPQKKKAGLPAVTARSWVPIRVRVTHLRKVMRRREVKKDYERVERKNEQK